MKKITSLLLVFCSILLMNSGCEKEESKNPKLLSLQISCFPEVFSVPGSYSDSIYYTNHQISRIDKYFRNNSERNTQSRLEYSGDEVKIFVRDYYWGFRRDFIKYNLYFKDSRIQQVETNSGRVKANYFYENNHLKYILYSTEGKVTDSISVQWDPELNNITRASWFKSDQAIIGYLLADAVDFSYDDKNNPHKNSIHFLYNFYDCEEFSLDYFNMNNPKTIKSTDYKFHIGYIYNYNLHIEYVYNDYNYPTSITFYNELNQLSDRNTIVYDCK